MNPAIDGLAAIALLDPIANLNAAVPDTLSTPKPRSGGPRTPQGKLASRRNAVKTGERSKVVFPDEMIPLVEQRVLDLTEAFAPTSRYEELLVHDMAGAAARFERCASLAAVDLVRVAGRAADSWDDDRSASVERFAEKLAKDPEKVARGLARSYHGAAWLIERWEALAAIAEQTGGWDEVQRALAFDLMGVPEALRAGTFYLPEGADGPALVEVARARAQRHRQAQFGTLKALSESERDLTMVGMPMQEDGVTARLRKNETRARSEFLNARKELLRSRGNPADPAARRKNEPAAECRDDRPALSDASIDYMVARANIPMMFRNIDKPPALPPVGPEPAEIEEIEEAEDDLFAAPAPEFSSGPNRRARKEQARRAREANRRSGG